MYAIKSIGRPVVDAILEERNEHGAFLTLQNFLERICEREINKKAVENLIKAGACDSLDGTRKQMLTTYATILDRLHSEKKKTMAGQLSLFDFVSEEEKQSYVIHYPDVGEYDKEVKFGFEKEVLGIYLTGHPLEEYEQKWKKNVTAVTTDFLWDEESREHKIEDHASVTVGGMIIAKSIKYTRKNQTMAFLTLEDLYGNLEVTVFPREYERYRMLLNEDEKIFIRGRANIEEDKDGKIICEKIYSFEESKRELWVQFDTKETFAQQEQALYDMLHDSDGNDSVVIYISSVKAMKRLGKNFHICINTELVDSLNNFFGKKNIKVVEKGIEKNQ